MQQEKILVIGGAGYIGSHVTKAFIEKGYWVTVYDDLSTGQQSNVPAKADFVKGDILDFALLNKTLSKGFDAVIHLAAKKAVGESMSNPQIYAKNNIIGSINIFNAMLENNIKNVVFSSSAAVYGIPQYLPIDEEHPLNPINFYGFTKLQIEQIMDWYSRLKDFCFVSFRYFNAVGYAADGKICAKEKNPQNLQPLIMENITGKRAVLSVFGNDYDTPDGTCLRDYIHVEDLANAHVLAVQYLQKHRKSQIFNLGTGKATSVLEIIKSAEKVTQKKVNYIIEPRRAGDPAVLTASSKKAENILGWKPYYTDIDEIIKTTWNMELQNNGNI